MREGQEHLQFSNPHMLFKLQLKVASNNYIIMQCHCVKQLAVCRSPLWAQSVNWLDDLNRMRFSMVFPDSARHQADCWSAVVTGEAAASTAARVPWKHQQNSCGMLMNVVGVSMCVCVRAMFLFDIDVCVWMRCLYSATFFCSQLHHLWDEGLCRDTGAKFWKCLTCLTRWRIMHEWFYCGRFKPACHQWVSQDPYLISAISLSHVSHSFTH